MKNIKLSAALKYQSMGFSVIPVKANKRPYLTTWKPNQTVAAGKKQIQSWWEKWPSANIGIVTGKISGIMALDADSDQGNRGCRPRH